MTRGEKRSKTAQSEKISSLSIKLQKWVTVPYLSKSFGLVSQQLKVNATIIINEEHVRAVIPPLRHMMHSTRNDDSRN